MLLAQLQQYPDDKPLILIRLAVVGAAIIVKGGQICVDNCAEETKKSIAKPLASSCIESFV